MATKRILSVDKTEIILIDLHTKRGQMNITQDQVAGITLEKAEVRKLFKKVTCEKITINIRKIHPAPYLLQSECGEHWVEYKTNLERFCKENRLPFTNNL